MFEQQYSSRNWIKTLLGRRLRLHDIPWCVLLIASLLWTPTAPLVTADYAAAWRASRSRSVYSAFHCLCSRSYYNPNFDSACGINNSNS